VLNGRLQHITTKWQWRFFEDKPDASSEHGFAKHSHTQDPEIGELISRLSGRFDFYWGAVDQVPVYLQREWVVCYAEQGRCFIISDPYRDTILMAKRKKP
jgi:hypothetical protein